MNKDLPPILEQAAASGSAAQGSDKITLAGEWCYLPADSTNLPPPEAFSAAPSMPIPSNWYLKGAKTYPGDAGFDYSGALWFQKKFAVPAEWRGRCPRLRFEMVDYFADVHLNGKHLGRHAGYFQPFEFEVQSVLRFGEENVLTVRVDSPALPVDLADTLPVGWPARQNLVKGIFLYHDTRPGGKSVRGQDKNTGGILGDVSLIGSGHCSLGQVRIATELSADHRSASVRVEFKVKNHQAVSASVRISAEIKPKNFSSDQMFTSVQELRVVPGEQASALEIVIPNPHLWWTWDYGRPDLYELSLRVLDGGAALDSGKFTFGVREIKIAPMPDWTWRLNGKKIFPRGSNYISTQWLSEMDKKKYLRDVQLMKDANMNAMRVHAHVEKKEFYEACDELGILVWQDFTLIWGYVDTPEFIEDAVRQLKDMIELLFNHPSIAVWCCHNESPFSVHFWMKQKDAAQNQVLDETLERKAREWDPTRFVHINSGTGDGHPYDGWYGGHVRNYREVPQGPMITEYGAQALPGMETMKKMFKADELWPPNWEKWWYHNFQKEQTLHIAGVAQGKSVEEFVNNSQTYQALYVKHATEIFRRRKHTKITGLFHFMFVEDWPSVTWAVVDYYRVPKKGYHALRTAFQPLLPSIEYDVEKPSSYAGLWIVNDWFKEFPGAVLKWKVTDAAEKTLQQGERRVDIPSDCAMGITKVDGLEGLSEGRKVLKVWIEDAQGKTLAENSLSAEDFHLLPVVAPKPGVREAFASSEKGDNRAAAAVDGHFSTRWESVHQSDPSWVGLRFTAPRSVRGVRVLWETAAAKKYEVQLSDDGKQWRTAAQVTDGKLAEDRTIVFAPQRAEYLRVYGTERNMPDAGYSIWEIEILDA